MPPALVVAGVAAAGAVGSAAIAGKAAKKASRAQATATAQQIAAIDRNRDYQYGLNAPTIQRGQAAESTIAGLLRVGGDAAGSDAAFNQYKSSTGYTARLSEGLEAVNNARFAGGMGQSGATLKALQRTGDNLASGEFNNYVGQLGGLASLGAGARGTVANVGSNSTNQFTAASQAGADARANYLMQSAGSKIGAVQGLVNAGLYAYGSSYGRAPGGAAGIVDPRRYGQTPDPRVMY